MISCGCAEKLGTTQNDLGIICFSTFLNNVEGVYEAWHWSPLS